MADNDGQNEPSAPDGGGKLVDLPLNPLKAFPGLDPAEISVLIVGGLGRGLHLTAGVDNGDGTATLLEQDLKAGGGVRMVFPSGAKGPHSFAITAISNDGHVKTGSLTLEPGLATVEAALVFEVDQPVVMDGGERLGFPINIGFASSLNRMVGDLEMALSGIPEGVHLTGGVPKGGGRWALSDGDLAGLSLVVPDGQGPFQAMLTVEARGQSGGYLEVTRTVLVGLAGQSVMAPELARAPEPEAEDAPAPPPQTAPQPTESGLASDAEPQTLDATPGAASAALPPAPAPTEKPKAAGNWLAGHGVFTFASGRGGDLYEGGYGWFDQVPDGTLSPAPDAPDGGMRLRLMSSGPVIEGPEPIIW